MSSPAQTLKSFNFNRGYYPSQDAYDGIPDTARDGANAWKKGNTWKSDAGVTSAGSSGGASPLMIANGAVSGMSGGLGNILYHLTVYWFAGSGNAIVGGSSIGTSTGKLCLVVSGVTYSAGLSKPSSAPTVADSGVASGIMAGSYAVAIVKYRATTGAVSTRSPLSLPVAVNKKKVRITLPANPGDGTTHWLIYGTRRNFAGLGLVFRVTSIDPIAVGTATYDAEWQDGDLGDAAPLTNDPAPTCTHCAALGGVMCAITTGGMVYPSKAGEPEAFDYGLAVRLASGEAPTAVIPQGAEGGQFVATLNSISILVLSGSPDVPVLPRGVFAQTGVAHGNAIAWAFDQLFGMSSRGLPFRSHGSSAPDSTFATPVLEEMKTRGFTGANTVVVPDDANRAVLYCSGNVAFPYMVDTGDWSAPITLPGAVGAGIDGKVAVGSTLYTLNSGSAPASTAYLQSPYVSVGGGIMTIETFRAEMPHNCTLDLIDGKTGASIGGSFPLSFTAPYGSLETLQPNLKVRSVALKWSTSVAARSPNSAFVGVTVEPGNH